MSSIPSVVAALGIAQLELRAGASVALRGRVSVEKRRFELESVSDQSVTVGVNGNTDYLVTFELADGRVTGFCECPDDDDWKDVICEHKVAAAIFLLEHYAAKPARAALSAAAGASAPGRAEEKGGSSKWRAELDHLLRKDTL
ncbi:MAG TPA: hypothetical protein VJ302_13655, partial [Blastocatellia bacterium]|nr:hypothetical protein [Blastocatellia bacterium]